MTIWITLITCVSKGQTIILTFQLKPCIILQFHIKLPATGELLHLIWFSFGICLELNSPPSHRERQMPRKPKSLKRNQTLRKQRGKRWTRNPNHWKRAKYQKISQWSLRWTMFSIPAQRTWRFPKRSKCLLLLRMNELTESGKWDRHSINWRISKEFPCVPPSFQAAGPYWPRSGEAGERKDPEQPGGFYLWDAGIMKLSAALPSVWAVTHRSSVFVQASKASFAKH